MAKPFLKWVGGKRALLPVLLSHMPPSFINYYEPFLGGGALFFELAERQAFGKAFISDFNSDLINAYRVISDQLRVSELISQLKFLQLHHSKEHYYKVRDRFNETKRTSDFIYLNRTGFNGLYRVNASGALTTPYGESAKTKQLAAQFIYLASTSFNAKIGYNKSKELMTTYGADTRRNNPFNGCTFDFENFLLCNESLKDASIIAQSYLKIKPGPGDFVYFDPPYDGTYTGYNSGGFTQSDQLQLSLFYKSLSVKGIYCMLSNADTPFIRERYKNFNLIEITAKQNLSGTVSGRQPRKELIITNY